MELTKSKRYNSNYLAKIVSINSFFPHPNEEVTRLKCAKVDGYTIIVGIDEKEGRFVYFPTSCTINPQLLSYANLYRDASKNADNTKAGMFEDNGRVKAIKLKGQVSEGFLLPLCVFQNFVVDSVNVDLSDEKCCEGTEFDEITHNGKSFWVNKKYIVEAGNQQEENHNKHYNKRQKRLKRINKMIDGQFRFHIDTVLIRKCPNAIQPDDLISITSKWDGTSHISSYVLCHKKLTRKEKIARFLTKNSFDEYSHILASRSVIKNMYVYEDGRDDKWMAGGFFGDDRARFLVDEYLKPFMTKGMTIYGEIVGYNANGKAFSKGYDYGCEMPKAGNEYVYGKHLKFAVYRVTYTNVDGIVYEFSAKQVQEWCKANGLLPVVEYYYGYARDLYPDIPEDENWGDNFIERLANEKKFHMEENSPECVNKVPHEGIVIRKDSTIGLEVFKLKCFAYLNREQKALDNGETNIEDLS